MSEKQQQLLFDKGITNVPSDVICSDNALEENIGLFHSNGEHRVIQKPKDTGVTVNGELCFVHNVNNEKIYVSAKDQKVWWKKKGGNTNTLFTYSGDKAPNITAIGYTLIVSDDNGLHYFKYFDNNYKELASKLPDLDFSAQLFSSDATQSFVVSTGKREGIVEANPDKAILPDPSQPTLYIDIFDIVLNQHQSYNDLIVGLYAENKNNIASIKCFCEPFLIRAAIELFDGSYTCITNPILLFPSVTKNSYCMIYEESLKLETFFQKLLLRQCTDFSDYSDLVKDVVVFVSDGIHIYNTNGDQPFEPSRGQRVYMENVGWVDIPPTGTFEYANRISSIDVEQPISIYRTHEPDFGSVPLTGSYHERVCYDALAKRSIFDIQKDIENASVFYKLCSIGKKAINNYEDATSRIQEQVLRNITTQETLGNDDYFSRSELSADLIYPYNSRLNLSGVKRSMFEGFEYFMPLDVAGFETYEVYVNVKTDERDVWVFRFISENHFGYHQQQGIYFYYPDQRATHVIIYRVSDGKCVCDADLKEHSGLNGAYYLRELPTSANVKEQEVTGEHEIPFGWCETTEYLNNHRGYREDLQNYILTSEINNPWVFNASGYNAVGTGRIIGMSTMTQALSQGQFGQYPLLVFSESGIWAMSLNNTGVFVSVHPMSREVCNNRNSITQTDGAVFFSSEKGLMVVVGPDVKCVSEQLCGKVKEGADFHTFLKEAFLAYDYRDSLLWIFDGEATKCWVYSIQTGTFSHYEFGEGNVVVKTVNDYPDHLLQLGDKVYSLLNRPNINHDGNEVDGEFVANTYDGCIITRPMKLENAFAQKSLLQIKNVRQMEGELSLRIYGSNDLEHWLERRSLAGIPWKYYKFRYDFSGMNATDRFAGAVVITQERRTNKLR